MADVRQPPQAAPAQGAAHGYDQASCTPAGTPYGVGADVDGEVGVSFRSVYAKMRATETVTYNPSARYLKHRRVLVDWMAEVGDDHKLHPSTVHVAIGYLDRFLGGSPAAGGMDVHRSRLQLVAMAAVVVAAKYEEEEARVPSNDAINAYANHSYPPKMVHQMEVLLLNRLSWCLTCVTPLHYLGAFSRCGVLFSDDSMAHKPLVPKAVRYAKKYMDFFADLCLQEYSFQQYPPSLLAAAIVVASRKALIMRPVWNPALAGLLRYGADEVAPVLAHVWAHYEANFPAETATTASSSASADAEALAAGSVTPAQLAADPLGGSSNSSTSASGSGGGAPPSWAPLPQAGADGDVSGSSAGLDVSAGGESGANSSFASGGAGGGVGGGEASFSGGVGYVSAGAAGGRGSSSSSLGGADAGRRGDTGGGGGLSQAAQAGAHQHHTGGSGSFAPYAGVGGAENAPAPKGGYPHQGSHSHHHHGGGGPYLQHQQQQFQPLSVAPAGPGRGAAVAAVAGGGPAAHLRSL